MNLLRPPKVFAQVDGVASPTIPFVPPGNVTPTTVGPTTGAQGPSISLSTDQTTLTVGARSKVQITIDTDLAPITSYNIQILFSPEFIRIVDFDESTDMVDVDFRDTFFDLIINEVSQQQGILTISAENPVGSASITDRVVAEFEIEALRTGFAELTFGVENTSLTTAASENILQTTNSLDFVIGGEEATVTPTIDLNVTTSPGPTTLPLPSGTPDTSLPDPLKMPLALVAGVMLISLGSYFYKLRGGNDHKKV